MKFNVSELKEKNQQMILTLRIHEMDVVFWRKFSLKGAPEAVKDGRKVIDS